MTDRMISRIVLWGAVVLGIALLVFVITRFTGTPNGPRNIVVPGVNETTVFDHVKGDAAAPITLVEYSDFQCPACRTYYPLVKELATELGDQLRIVYRHFPLTQIHTNADLAARAAEAAALQGKFWEMHDLLFEKQGFWSAEGAAQKLFIEYAGTLDLNTEQFTRDLDAASVKDKVANDRTSGNRAGINGTPTFFVNGTQITNPRSYADFRALVTGATK